MGAHDYSITVSYTAEEKESDNPIAGQTKKAREPKGNATAKAAVKALVAYNAYVKPFVDATVNQHIQTIALRTGATETQQRIQFAYDIGKQAVGIGTSILAGLAIGNLPGAIIGAAIGVTTSVINYANKEQTLKLEQNLENITLRGMNVRAGGYAPSYSASRTGRQ